MPNNICYNISQNKSIDFEENNIKINESMNNYSNNCFLLRIQSFKGPTDITDNSYYDKISKKLILQMNQNYVDYNNQLVHQRYNPNNRNNSLFLRKNKLSDLPGHVSSPRYYNLGEFKLRSNPIVYPGNRAPIFNQYNNFNHSHKLKSEFI